MRQTDILITLRLTDIETNLFILVDTKKKMILILLVMTVRYYVYTQKEGERA